jgi:hypothetical protein
VPPRAIALNCTLKTRPTTSSTDVLLGELCGALRKEGVVLERLDAFLDETDEAGRIVSYDRVAVVAVVVNEDGAHHDLAELYVRIARRWPSAWP